MRNIIRHWPSSIKVGWSKASTFYRKTLNCIIFRLADQAYNAVKAESKRALDDSKLVLNEVTPELREEYQVIENVRLQYERELNAAKENGLPLPPTEGVDLRTSEELREELETQRANLDLNLASNPGVVEQYEKRKREVRGCLPCVFVDAVLIIGLYVLDRRVGEDDRGETEEGCKGREKYPECKGGFRSLVRDGWKT